MSAGNGANAPAEQRMRVIVSVGADVDAAALEDEIRAEVARKEREGIYGPELLLAIAPDALSDRMEALRGAAELSLDPPLHSTRPGLGPMVAAVKGALARTLRWHTRWLVGQVQTLGGSTVAAMSAMTERLDEMQQQVDLLSGGLARVEAAQLAGANGSVAGTSLTGALSDVANLRELALRPPAGRIACLCCGDGRLLAALSATGAPCYGVEPDAGRSRSCADRGLDVRAGDVIEHLAGLPRESLAGIVVESGERLGATGVHDLFCLAAAALRPGAALVLEIAAGDVSCGSAGDGLVHELPFQRLAEEAGFRTVKVGWPEDPVLAVSATRVVARR